MFPSQQDTLVHSVTSARNWRAIPLHSPCSHPVYLQCTRNVQDFSQIHVRGQYLVPGHPHFSPGPSRVSLLPHECPLPTSSLTSSSSFFFQSHEHLKSDLPYLFKGSPYKPLVCDSQGTASSLTSFHHSASCPSLA